MYPGAGIVRAFVLDRTHLASGGLRHVCASVRRPVAGLQGQQPSSRCGSCQPPCSARAAAAAALTHPTATTSDPLFFFWGALVWPTQQSTVRLVSACSCCHACRDNRLWTGSPTITLFDEALHMTDSCDVFTTYRCIQLLDQFSRTSRDLVYLRLCADADLCLTGARLCKVSAQALGRRQSQGPPPSC